MPDLTMPDLTMPGLTIHTLGQETVLLDGLEPDWHADSARTLLFYLLGHPDGQPHGTIVQALWNPEPGGASVACLRVAVCRLRAALGDPGSVVTDRQRYRLALPVLERADTFQFAGGLHLARRGPPRQRIAAYGRALAHYAGDHLPLEQGEWAQPFRARLCGDAAQAGLGTVHPAGPGRAAGSRLGRPRSGAAQRPPDQRTLAPGSNDRPGRP
ncbi:hypothetical protein ACI3L1_15540 [Deinococcus sp. SM5_A1]|uniref:AfsR/SARP family transcriptional regulator n=1 Tax=Deinococcus sp. SM5_A1 TaxID=3379094 RepID=UPI00385B68AF